VRGAELYVKSCEHCHTVEKGEAHVFGPNLYGIFGQKSGQIPGSKPSQAYKEKAITWTPETMVCQIELSSGSGDLLLPVELRAVTQVAMGSDMFFLITSLSILRIQRSGSRVRRSHTKDWRVQMIGTTLLRECYYDDVSLSAVLSCE